MKMLGDRMEKLGELEDPSGKERWSCPATSLCCKATASSIPVQLLPARDNQQVAEAALGVSPLNFCEVSPSSKSTFPSIVPSLSIRERSPGGGCLGRISLAWYDPAMSPSANRRWHQVFLGR